MGENDMYHACRWCKHYNNGYCNRDNFYIYEKDDLVVDKNIDVLLEVKEPESFYCSNWE